MANSTRFWTEVTPSEHAHERAALHFIRQRFPDREPFRAWTNFMFMGDDGAGTKSTCSWSRRRVCTWSRSSPIPAGSDGDAGTWTWTTPDGYQRTFDNPLLLAERQGQEAQVAADESAGVPVATAARRRLLPEVRRLPVRPGAGDWPDDPGPLTSTAPTPRADPDQRNDLPGIVEPFTRVEPKYGRQVDRPLSQAIAQAMDQAGIRESQPPAAARPLRARGPDGRGRGLAGLRAVQHPGQGRPPPRPPVPDRARAHPRRSGTHSCGPPSGSTASSTTSTSRHRSPRRPAPDPRGPALIFQRDPKAVRLDHWLADHGDNLDLSTGSNSCASSPKRSAPPTGRVSTTAPCRPSTSWCRHATAGRGSSIRDWQAAAREVTPDHQRRVGGPAHRMEPTGLEARPRLSRPGNDSGVPDPQPVPRRPLVPRRRRLSDPLGPAPGPGPRRPSRDPQ